MNATRALDDPFDDGRNLAARVGTDFKMGLGSNLTLEATVNPDFGQVEADPAEVNLTAFATRFPERRPFFTEGARLLTTPNQSKFFYSRRIGARPIGPARGDYVDYPDDATILFAGKVTGRLPSRTSSRYSRRDHRSGVCENCRCGFAGCHKGSRRASCGLGRRTRATGVWNLRIDVQRAGGDHAPQPEGGRSAGGPAGAKRFHVRSRHAAAFQGRRIRTGVGGAGHARDGGASRHHGDSTLTRTLHATP